MKIFRCSTEYVAARCKIIQWTHGKDANILSSQCNCATVSGFHLNPIFKPQNLSISMVVLQNYCHLQHCIRLNLTMPLH